MALFLDARVKKRNNTLELHKKKLQEKLQQIEALKNDAVDTLPSDQKLGTREDLFRNLDEEIQSVKSRVWQLFNRIDSSRDFINATGGKEQRQAILNSQESESIMKEVKTCEDLCESFQRLVLETRQYVLCKGDDRSALLEEIERLKAICYGRHEPEPDDLSLPSTTPGPIMGTSEPPKTPRIPKTPAPGGEHKIKHSAVAPSE